MSLISIDLARADHAARQDELTRSRRAGRAATARRLQRRAKRLSLRAERVSHRAERAASQARRVVARAL